MIDLRFKFYLVIKISDFLNWKNNHLTAWQMWRDRFINAFDVTEFCRKSINDEYAIIENRLAFFNSRERVIQFENLISNFSWVKIFPLKFSAAWVSAGYTQSIFDLFNQYPNLWNPEIT